MTPEEFAKKDRDYFVLSKVMQDLLYIVLAFKGL